MRFVVACLLALLAAASAGLTAHSQDLLLPNHDNRAGHVDAYTGHVTVRAQEIVRGEPGIVVLVDDRQFLFQLESPVTLTRVDGAGVVQFWHDGLRVVVPEARRAFELRVRGKGKIPAAVASSRFRLARFSGFGLVERTGPLPGLVVDAGGVVIAGSDYCEDCPFYPDDPGQGGSGGSCATKSCSVTCSSGQSCSASCSGGNKAECSCSSGSGPGGVSQPSCKCSAC